MDIVQIAEEMIRDELSRENFFDGSKLDKEGRPMAPARRATKFIGRVLAFFAMVLSLGVLRHEDIERLANAADLISEDVIRRYGEQFANEQRKGAQEAQTLGGFGMNLRDLGRMGMASAHDPRADTEGRIRG